MHNEFTAIIERDGDWFIAYCPEITGANGQGKTKDECLNNLSQAIDLILAFPLDKSKYRKDRGCSPSH